MSSREPDRLSRMGTTQQGTTITSLAVTMFTVADVDAARDFYVDTLGFELRADLRFGEHGENRWLEVAPPGSTARIALNPPMGNEPGHSVIGLETPDVLGEHARLTAIGGLDVDPEPMRVPGAPLMFAMRDPDGNGLWITEPAPQG